MDVSQTYRKTNIFPELKLYIHSVPGDGSCLIHSICAAIYIPYKTQMLNGKRVSRTKIVKRFRRELADRLTEIDPTTHKSYYKSISGGVLYEMGRNSEEFSLNNIRKLFESDEFLGEETISIIEYILNISIYILDGNKNDIYHTSIILKERNSVVLYYKNNHFEYVTFKEIKSGHHITYFKYDHPFIKFLRNRIMSIKK